MDIVASPVREEEITFEEWEQEKNPSLTRRLMSMVSPGVENVPSSLMSMLSSTLFLYTNDLPCLRQGYLAQHRHY